MSFEVFNTHLELSPYKKDDYPVIEKLYTAMDKFTQNEFPCGYTINEGTLYLPRGTSISKIEQVTGEIAKYDTEDDPFENMNRKHHSFYDTRNKLQEDSIMFLTENSNKQLALNLSMGYGKSFCVAYASTRLNEKTLIITPNDGLKNQWMKKTFMDMFDYKKNELMNISGSSVMEDIMNDIYEPCDVYFVNHQTLQSYLSNHSPYMLHQFFKKLKIGIKVYDESHLQFANILFMDFFSNTKRTWYLTATFDRSDKTESVCFKRAFNAVETFGEMESFNEQRKHVIYHVVNIRSRIDNKQLRKVIGYNGLSAVSYGKYAFFEDKNQTMYMAIKIIVDKLKDVEGKILIFVPLIDIIEDVVKKLKDEFPDKTIGPYHSKISKDEKEDVLKKDIIVSTIASCGTGVDIKRLRAIICSEAFASKVTAKQVIGRLREYAPDKDTYYFDIIDVSVPILNYWFRARCKAMMPISKNTIYLNLDE